MTAPLFGLSSLHEYYNGCSNRDKIHKIQKPLVCTTSEDDPFVLKECKFAESHVPCGGNDTISICSFFVEIFIRELSNSRTKMLHKQFLTWIVIDRILFHKFFVQLQETTLLFVLKR